MSAIVRQRTAHRSFLLGVAAIMLACSASASLAANVYPADCAIAQYELLSAYQELSYTPKDNRLLLNLKVSNKTLSECVSNLSHTLSPDLASKLNAAQSGMHDELNYNINSLAKTGGAPGQSIASMLNYALATTSMLGNQKNSSNATVDSLLKQAVLMAQVKNRYLERVFYLGGGGRFRESSADASIEELTQDFSKRLDVLRQDKTLLADKELYKKLNTAHVRFNFLKKSIVDYATLAVPFVVEHHTKFIIKTLMEISNALEQKPA